MHVFLPYVDYCQYVGTTFIIEFVYSKNGNDRARQFLVMFQNFTLSMT
jgi:hypothetical protein